MGMGGMSALSLGEAEALVAKAARGAGMPWGLAAEAGKAARRAFGAGAAEVDASFVTWLSGDPGGPQCPLVRGLLAAEGGAETAQNGSAAQLIYNAAARRLSADPDIKRAQISPEAQDSLEALAHRTYAPATEESRARGAG